MSITYPDHFLEELPVLDTVDGSTIICAASGPDFLSYQLAVSVLFTSPEFLGEPTAPTPPPTDDSTRIATTEFVQYQISNLDLTGVVHDTGDESISGEKSFTDPVHFGPDASITPDGKYHGDGSLLTGIAAGVAIGDPITGGTAKRILLEGTGGVLADSVDLTFDPAIQCMGIGTAPVPGYPLMIGPNITYSPPKIGMSQLGVGLVSVLAVSGYVDSFQVLDGLTFDPLYGSPATLRVNFHGGVTLWASPSRVNSFTTYQLNTTTARRNTAIIDAEWADNTDSLRRGRLLLKASDASGDRTGMVIESNGTIANVMIPNMVLAVNDSAAAAAGVPVKGLYYLSDGTVKIRLV